MSRISSLPLLLYSYIATEMLAPFYASFLILYCVFFLVRLIPLLNVVLELRIGFADFIRLSSYIFPHMLLYVIPMASMTGVIIGFTRMTNDREILSLKACGISLRQLLPPVIFVALAISSLTGFFSVHLIPAGEVAMRRLMFQLAKEKIEKGLQEKTFTEALGDLVIYVDRIDKDKGWHGVYVSDMRDRRQPVITMAQSGHLSADIKKMLVTIVLNNGTLHHTDGADNQVIKFHRYQIQIPIRPPTRIDGDDITRISKGEMSQSQLLQAADKYGRKTRKGISFLTEFHHRLSLPVGCFILSLLGLPLGLQAGPGKRAIGIPLGLAFFILYYLSFTVVRILCENLLLPVIPGMWLPNIFFLGLTILIFSRVEREKPIISEWIQSRVANVYNFIVPPVISSVGRLTIRLLQWRPRHPSRQTTGQKTANMPIHADSVNRIYHRPGCRYYDCELCTIKFKDARVAEDAGFKPCLVCKNIPDESSR
ncbi:Lipopolysaccharide export system permease protein LptF [hydrothermal vent metagenome]|uniref:Lipopolysaccharide export system permease protein LptF n=1 Tax=hydrothermal vent metagenome TaxID=652676 RepID=A0A3B0W7W9_9ZZZZ